MPRPITVLLAEDNLIVREGVKALLVAEPDIDVVGVAADFDEIVAQADRLAPGVLIADIRMPPSFQQEGIEAAWKVRQHHPATGVVILSQYDEPEYAISLLEKGAAGCAYLLKDRVAECDQLARAVRAVAAGDSMLDSKIVDALLRPVTNVEMVPVDQSLLHLVAEGRPIKAIAAARRLTPGAVAHDIEQLFLALAEQASSGDDSALRRLRLLHKAIVDREELGESMNRFLPGGVAEMLRREGGGRPGETERMVVTVLMSDIRSYSSIAEQADPAVLAGQLNAHRAAMNAALLEAGGTVMQLIGDAVMAVFGMSGSHDDHADRALEAAAAMHAHQAALNQAWTADSLPAFELGIGLSTGEVAAAVLGSDERLDYTVVGDTVNLAARLQQWAAAGEVVVSEATRRALREPPGMEALRPALVKGRQTPVIAFRIPSAAGMAL